MANNWKQIGENITLAKANIDSGDPILEGKLVGVANIDTDSEGDIVARVCEVWDLQVEGVNDGGNSAVVVGDEVYYSEGDDPVINKKKSGIKFGIALEAINSGSTDTIEVAVYPGENEIWKSKVFLTDDRTLEDAIDDSDDLKIMRYAKATYDFETQDGTVGAHGSGITIPENAVIMDGVVDVQQTLTDDNDDSATLAIHVEGADDVVAAVAINNATDWDKGLHDIVPDGQATNMIKTTDEREITFTVGDDEIVEGKVTVILGYIITEADVA